MPTAPTAMIRAQKRSRPVIGQHISQFVYFTLRLHLSKQAQPSQMQQKKYPIQPNIDRMARTIQGIAVRSPIC